MSHVPQPTRRSRFTMRMGRFAGVGAATVVALLLVVCTAAALPSAAAATAVRSEADAQPDWSVQSSAAHARPWRNEGGDSDSNIGNSKDHGLRVGYAPLRTFHAVRGADDFGAAHSALFDLPHPSTLVTTSVQMGKEGEEEDMSAIALSDVDDAEFSLDDLDGSVSPIAFAAGSTGRSGPRSPSSTSHTPTQFDTIRDSMLNSKWMDDTKQSSSNSMAFLRSFPRRKMDGSSGSNQLQRLGGPFNRTAANSAESDPIGDYLASMFFMYGVPLFFAMLAIVVWAGFCVARCWCNLCGRHATVLYTDKQVRINYVLVVLLIIIMGVCAAFGWTGNVQVSQGLDKGFLAADLLANYGYEFMGVASTAYAIGYDALLLGTSFNQTMELVPPGGLLNDSSLCVEDSHLVLESQAALVASLTDARAQLWGSPQQRAALDRAASGVGAVRAAMLRLATPLPPGAPVPAGGSAGQSTLQNLHQQLHSLNASLSSLPNATALEGIISHLGLVSSWSESARTLGNLSALAGHFGALDSAAATLAPALTSFASQGLAALEQGVAALTAPSALPTAMTLTPSDDASRAGDLVSSYDGVMLALNTSMPRDFSALLLRFQEMRDELASLNATLPLVRASLAGYRLSTGAPWPASGSGGDEAVYAELSADLGRFESFQQSQGPALASMLGTEMPALIAHLARMRQEIPRALASLGATAGLLQAVRDGPTPTDPAALAQATRAFNETAGRVECFLGVLALLQETNATLVVMPGNLSSVHERLLGPLQAQVASMETLRDGLARAAAEWDAVNTTLSAEGAPDFDALAAALEGLNATLSDPSLADFEALWAEILPLAQAMHAATGADGVEVSWAAPVWTIQPGDDNATASYPTALWGSVESVSPRAAPAGGFVSALSGLVDLPHALEMTAPLQALEALVDALEAQLGGAGLSATLLEQHAQSLASFAEAASTLPPLLRAALPLASSLPLPLERQTPLLAALNALSDAVASRPPVAPLQSMLGSSALNGTLGSSQALSERLQISLALRGLHAGLVALPSLPRALRMWHSNATGAFPTLQGVLAPPGQVLLLQIALDSAPGAPLASLPGENEKLQSMRWGFNMTGVSALLSTLEPPAPAVAPSLSLVERDAFLGSLALFHDFASYFPDFDAKLSQGSAGLSAIGGALEYMEETKQLYQRKRTDFKSTIDNYDGVRLLIFNLGVIFPFILSFFLLLAAIQHYGCPAMVAGLTFFPLFVLFMCMSAIQMPVSVALSDHCYNSTGEIKIQTDGRSYPASKLAFFNLASDIDVPSVVDYFTECKGAAPELLVKLRDPMPILQQQGLESGEIQAAARKSIGLDFAEPLASDFRRLDALQVRTLDMFNTAVSKLNCTRSSSIYHAAMEAVCTDFGPAFALTTCVFLLTAVCMVPGVCIGVTSYKRFNPVNRDAAYTKARGSEDQHVINDPSVPEGWN